MDSEINGFTVYSSMDCNSKLGLVKVVAVNELYHLSKFNMVNYLAQKLFFGQVLFSLPCVCLCVGVGVCEFFY